MEYSRAGGAARLRPGTGGRGGRRAVPTDSGVCPGGAGGRQEILEHWEDYPEELLELLARNPETLEFVRNYPREKDRAPAETVEEAQAGEIPLLLQWDPRWGYAQYGDGPMALNGCGPTALSMVICGLTGDASATPWAVAQYAQEMGYYVEGVGTSWELMSTGCRHFGVTAQELP